MHDVVERRMDLNLIGCRASIHTPYAIQARMEYGVWLKPRMERYGIYIPYGS